MAVFSSLKRVFAGSKAGEAKESSGVSGAPAVAAAPGSSAAPGASSAFTASDDIKASGKVHSLHASGIVRVYDDEDGRQVRAIDGFDLHIEGPEVVGIVGPSGCGKSTFLRLAAGLDRAQGGRISYDGEPIEGPHYDRGMVFQSPTLYDWLTVRDNIAFGLKARGVYRGSEERVAHYVDFMGLAGFEDSYPYQISGGMASRVALARTFVQEPGLILLDEPLSALDAFTRATLQDEIIRMHQSSDAIFVLVTHDVEEAVYLCDRVVVMSARPGTNVGEVKIGMPHPRDRMSEDFVAKRREILEMMAQSPARE